MTPSLGESKFHLSGDNIFNLWGMDEVHSRAMAKYAYNNNCNTATILSSHQPWSFAQGNFFSDEFKKLGGTIKLRIDVLPDQTSFKTEVLKVKTSDADCLFLSNYISLGFSAKELKSID